MWDYEWEHLFHSSLNMVLIKRQNVDQPVLIPTWIKEKQSGPPL